MPTAQFEEGDVVQLKSGGPFMTVIEVDSDDGPLCQWFDKAKVQIGRFSTIALKKADEGNSEFFGAIV